MKEVILCKDIQEHIGVIGHVHYLPCDRKAKYKVSFKEGLRGRLVEKNVCGIHFNSIKKWSERMMNRMNWDSELKFVEI